MKRRRSKGKDNSVPLLLEREPVFTKEPERLPQVDPISTKTSGRWLTNYFRIWYPVKRASSWNWFIPWIFVSPKPRFVLLDETLGSNSGRGTWQFIREIESLSELHDDFNGYGSEAPNDESIKLASQVVLSAVTIKPTRVVASAHGGVVIYFVRAGKRADIECLNTGEIVATISENLTLPRVWEIRAGEIKKTLGILSDFLER
jgi:hypothetical protein